MSCVIYKDIPFPEFSAKEALRYVGCKQQDHQLAHLASTCHGILKDNTSPKLCYLVCPLTVNGDTCTVLDTKIISHHLAKHLSGCHSVMLLGATLGSGADRMMARYSITPSKAVMLQAVATAAVESVCDSFLHQYAQANGVSLRPRFSPGYGDLPLETQSVLFKLLDPKRIGLYLTDSFILTPTKSVTAFVGIDACQNNEAQKNKCDGCTLLCSFRS